MKTTPTTFISHCVFALISLTLVESCIAQANVSLTTKLVEAASVGDIELVVRLIGEGADVNGVHGGPANRLAGEDGGYSGNGQFWTPLRAAVANEHDTIASYLIGVGAKVTSSDRPEWSEFHYIAFRDSKKNVDVSFLKLLLIAGADPQIPFKCITCVHDAMYFNMSPLQLARIRRNVPLAEFLAKQWGASKTKVPGTDPNVKKTTNSSFKLGVSDFEEFAQPNKLVLAIADGGWNRESQDLPPAVVCRDAIETIWKAAGRPQLPPIAIVNDTHAQGPSLQLRRGINDTFVIHLHSSGDLPSQLVYQTSHEFGHLLCNSPGLKTNKLLWFEEALCECASLYSLRKLSTEWKAADSIAKRKYAKNFALYANARINSAGTLPSLPEWYRKNRATLATRTNDYDFLLPASIKLLAYFEANPDAWQIVEHLNEKMLGDTFEIHLANWRRSVERNQTSHVDAIGAIFGIEVKQVNKTKVPRTRKAPNKKRVSGTGTKIDAVKTESKLPE